MNGRRSAERLLVLCAAVAAAFLTAACSVEMTIAHPACEGGGSWAIVAQSVPSASQVPCLDPLPQGWEVETVKIDQSGTVVTMNSDRAGTIAARMHFTASCDIGDAVATPTDHRDTERFEEILQLTPGFVANRYYRFDGGCVWWEFEFDEEAPAALSVELGNALQLLYRADLQEQLSDVFLDEEL